MGNNDTVMIDFLCPMCWNKIEVQLFSGVSSTVQCTECKQTLTFYFIMVSSHKEQSK